MRVVAITLLGMGRFGFWQLLHGVLLTVVVNVSSSEGLAIWPRPNMTLKSKT